MSYSEAMALIRQAERAMTGGNTAATLPMLGILPKLPPQLPAPRR